MLETLAKIDSEIFLWFNGHMCEYGDSFFWLFSGKIIWVGLYAAIIVALFRRFGWRVAVGMLLAIGIIIALSDQICGNFARHAFERLRPSNPANPFSSFVHIVNGYRGGAYGFPSCHAANSFALATFVMLVFRYRWLTVSIYLWAILTAYSRLVLGVHYPGDLLAGAAVGSLVAAVTYYVARIVYRRYFSCRAPFAAGLHPGRAAECQRLILGVLGLTVIAIAIIAI
ncbi:MAG: phosphatase PAP2 family protein [Muribaculaceae bacterium]|nr:phosphatase PAP2 family protein [Muribaculaceae bacterium]